MEVVARDVQRLGAVTPDPAATAEWNREFQALGAATRGRSDSLGTVSSLVQATTNDPAANLFEHEERPAPSGPNPLHTQFSALHPNTTPVAHYTAVASKMTGRRMRWDANALAFVPDNRIHHFIEF